MKISWTVLELQSGHDFVTELLITNFKKKNTVKSYGSCTLYVIFCLFVLGFYGPVNNEVMSSRSANSGTVPGQA